jgi:RNA polymerase sigma-70 factor (ECF subfamily)
VKVTGTESDEEIAAVAKRGERSAFDALVNRHKAAIYRFVRRYIGHSDDAYDVLQDCFIASWQALPRYDTARPFLPWLRVIALNKCRDFTRRQKVRRLFLRAFALEANEAQQISVLDSGERDPKDDRLSRLDEAISRLDAFYKEPLLLTTVSGLSHIEAATLLKTTPKAIEMRIYRARKKLLENIEENEGEG